MKNFGAVTNVTLGAVRFGRLYWMNLLEERVLRQLSADVGFNYTIKRFPSFVPTVDSGNCSLGKNAP